MPLPKDIIYEIIDYLCDDRTNLLSCALVSRTFYLACRKYVFSSAYLNHHLGVHALCSLLGRNPALAPLFRTLHVTLAHPQTLSHIPRVLPLLTQVNHLILGTRGEPVSLNRGDIITAIPPLLHLPRLEQLELRWISNFPAAYLSIPLKIRSLDMEFVDITVPIRGNYSQIMAASRPMSLKSIRVDMMENIKQWPPLNTPNLRQISIQRPGRGTQQIIKANAQSLRDVIWNNYDPRDRDVDLDVIHKLRRLSFVLSKPYTLRTPNVGTAIEDLWTSIRDILRTGHISKGLEELNVAIKSYQGGMSSIHNDLLVIQGSSLWSALADRSQFPRLKRITIYLDAGGCSPKINDNNADYLIARKLPLLQKTGLLHVKLCNQFNWHTLL